MATCRGWFALAWALCLAPLAAGAQPAPLERALTERIEADAEERTSQRRVDELDDATQKMLTEYRRALTDAESYEAYVEQLEAQVHSQGDEKATIERNCSKSNHSARCCAEAASSTSSISSWRSTCPPLASARKRVAKLKICGTRGRHHLREYRRILEATRSLWMAARSRRTKASGGEGDRHRHFSASAA